MSEQENLLEARYGRAKQRGVDRRIGWVTLGVVLLGVVAFIVFGGWQPSNSIEYKTISYSVDDDTHATAKFQVSAKPGIRVACAVEALAPSKATVGWRVVEYPASEERTRNFTETVLTTYPATTATVRYCFAVNDAT